MVSDTNGSNIETTWGCVLILVLMEYGLWHRLHYALWAEEGRVLILVLMEYGLWQYEKAFSDFFEGVLILVLMEYGLWR